MIFRRFLQRLKQHQWGAIATELVIVIIGVFIGMQVSNWNEERETSQKAAVFTERLRKDMRKEAWAYEDLIQYSRETNASQRRVLDALSGDVALSDEQFLISAYRATQYIYNVRFRATYDELVSTGAIGLIADEKLRETAMSIFTTPLLDQVLQGARESEYRHLFRETVSAEVQQDLLSRCGDHYATVLDYDSIVGSINYPCTLSVAQEKIRAAVVALKSQPRFIPSLQVRFADNQTALTDLQVAYKPTLDSLRSMRRDQP
jgi:hypothetical protein